MKAIRHIAASIIAAFAFPVAAQQIVLPCEVSTDLYANIAPIDLSSHLNAFEMRELKSLQENEAEILANDLLGYADTFKGVRYRRGGKTPSGFDCSGFTGYVFRQFGFNLGASSREQWNDGHAVEADEVRPGDLLFFTGRAANSGRVGHVGIVVSTDEESGDITFIHSSCSSGVTIDRVSDPYYKRRFLGARRVIE